MFRARRRPLLGAAMIGGAGMMAGRRSAQTQGREQDQEQRLEQLEAEQPAAPAATAAPAAPAGGTDLVDRLKELSQLQQSGALSQEEFQAAKQKLLAS